MPGSSAAIEAAKGTGPAKVIIEGNRIIKACPNAHAIHVGDGAVSASVSNNVIESWDNPANNESVALVQVSKAKFLDGAPLPIAGDGNVIKAPMPVSIAEIFAVDEGAQVTGTIEWKLP